MKNFKTAGAILAVLAALALLAGYVQCKFVVVRARDVTGTRVRSIIWFGLFHQHEINESPLAKWCHAHGVVVKETEPGSGVWSRESVLGGIEGGGGLIAPISRFSYGDQEIYLSRENDAAIRNFIAQMSAAAGDHQRQQELVEAAVVRTKELAGKKP